MANAKKCDRCGVLFEEIEPSPIAELSYSLATATRQKFGGSINTPRIANADLCKDCEQSLNKWWKEGSG